MLLSGSADSSGDNECQALTPPTRSNLLVTDFSNRKPKAIIPLHQHSALQSAQQLKQVGSKLSYSV